ncbi:MAG: M14 family metallopeptidase [bacterium]
MFRKFMTITALIIVSQQIFAQSIPFSGSLDPGIPTIQSVLGYDIGERFTDYRNLERYIDALSRSTNRMQRIVYGETNEHRPLQIVAISSPENLQRIEAIKSSNLKLTDPRNFKSSDELKSALNDLPVIVFLSYGVHGNEACSPEAALLTAYQLCASTDQSIKDILNQAIVLIDPLANPDGHERYAQWANSALGKFMNTNPSAYEHSEPWPGGRTNHYFFDLNRDWAWQTQIETRSRLTFYRQWMPHVHVDYHEMGYTSTYFFFPAAVPVHESLPPDVVKWAKIFAQGNAQALDNVGASYYVGESFDLFYPGYGDSWPTFNGAIGMTYEQAGGSRGAFAVRRPGGAVLTLRDRARNHFLTSMATISTSVKNRLERIKDFSAFWETGLKNSESTKGYLITEGRDPNRTGKLVQTLIDQGIEVYQLQEVQTLSVQKYFSKKPSNETIDKGSYYIPLQQPHQRLARVLLEPKAAFRDTFFYDISAWSLPVAYGVAAHTTESVLPSSAKKINRTEFVQGKIIGGKAAFAYLIPLDRNNASILALQLLQKKYSLSVAHRPFEIAGRTFGRGTMIVRTAENGTSLHKTIEDCAKSLGVDIYAANSGLTDQGISLGSNYISLMKKAEVAIATGEGVSSGDYGELWHLFDQELNLPFTAVRLSELTSMDLSQIDVVILPDGNGYQTTLDTARTDRLKRWVQSGGVLIGFEGGAQYLMKNRSAITTAALKAEKREEEKSKEEKEQDRLKKEAQKRLSYFDKSEKQRLDMIPGSIFKALIDTTHPIGYGYPSEIFVFKSGGQPLELTETGHNVARFAKDSLQTSGYASAEKAGKLSEAAYIQEFRFGSGRVVLFSESISFRRFWQSLQNLLLNSILFLPQPR